MSARTPKLADRAVAGLLPETSPEPPPVSGDELAALCALAEAMGARTVMIGSGRDETSRRAADWFAQLWTWTGRTVLDTVTWPERAASWLRQAKRLTSPCPDVWVLGGPPAGLAQMTRRLAWSTPWSPSRTLIFGGIADALPLAGPSTLEGVRGVGAGGEPWWISDGEIRPLHPSAVRAERNA